MKRSYDVNRNGVTLVEVVASLVLLATLVTSMLLAYSAHHRQALLAIRKQKAIEVADEMLATWYASTEPTVPRNGSGTVLGSDGLVWRTSVVHQNVVETLPVEVVRLQVLRAEGGARAGSSPLAQVDVVVPIPESRL